MLKVKEQVSKERRTGDQAEQASSPQLMPDQPAQRRRLAIKKQKSIPIDTVLWGKQVFGEVTGPEGWSSELRMYLYKVYKVRVRSGFSQQEG